MTELSQLLTEETVIDSVPQPNGSTIVFAEDCGPAPNAVDVWSDHTDQYHVAQLSCDVPGQLAYTIVPKGE
jgi:hypothetical protein